MRGIKRVLATILALAMVFSLLTINTFAEGNVAEVTIDGKTTQYTAIADAFADFVKGTGTEQTIKLLANATQESRIEFIAGADETHVKTYTMDLNGYELDYTGSDGILVRAYDKVKIYDSSAEKTGSIKYGDSNTKFLQFNKNVVNVTIEDVYMYGSNVTKIQGSTNASPITIKSGKFSIDPSDFAAGSVSKNENDGTWTVTQSSPAAKIGDTEYASFGEALTAANATTGVTIVLQKNCSVTAKSNSDFEVKSTITLDLNGYTIENKGSVRFLTVKSEFTVTDSSQAGTGAIIDNSSMTTNNGAAIYVSAKGSLNIEGGTIQQNSGAKNMIYVSNDSTAVANISGGAFLGVIDKGSAGSISISGGWFTKKADEDYYASDYISIQVSDEAKKATPYSVTKTSYEVTYDYTTNNGSFEGTGLEPTVYPILEGYSTAGIKIRTAKPVGPSGFIFKEWNTMANGSGTAYEPGQPVTLTADMTLYAVYEVGTVVAVDSDLNEYMSLNDAFTVEGARTITLIADVCDNVIVPANATINLNLNGHNITGAAFGGSCVKVSGVLNLYNAPSGEQAGTEGVITGYAQSTGGAIDILGGTFRMFGGTVQGCATSHGAGIIAESAKSKCYIYGGTVKALAGEYTNANGTVTSVDEAIYGQKADTIIEIGGVVGNDFTAIPKAADIRIDGSLAVTTAVASAKLLMNQTVYYTTNTATNFTLLEGKNFVANREEATSAYGYVLGEAYAITYNLDGGEVETTNPEYIAKDDTVAITLKPATKSGYVFKGWYKDVTDENTKVTSLKGTDLTDDIELTAKWNAAVAKVGEGYYDSLADAIAAAPANGTVTLMADCTITSQIKITKSITLTTDGNGDHTIYIDPAFTSGWAIDWGVADSKISGTATSRIIIDGSKLDGKARERGLLYVHASGCQIEYVTVQNNTSTPNKDTNGGGGIYCSTSSDASNPIILRNIKIENCKTDTVGNSGCLNIAGQYINVYDSVFVGGTTSEKLGEQIYVTSSGVSIIIDGCSFTRNANSKGYEVCANKSGTVTVSNCTFDVKSTLAVNNCTSTNNKFNIAAPTQAETEMVDTGSVIALTTILDGFDADSMTATITKNTEAETEVNGVGTYVITVSTKTDHYFPAESVTEFTFIVSSATTNVASVKGTEYLTFGDAIEAAEEGDTIVILEDVANAIISKKVIIDTTTNNKTIATATIKNAALPLDISKANITSVTFDTDVENNTEVFVGDETAQTITNEGKGLVVGTTGKTFFTVANPVARISDVYYDTLAAAIAAAPDSGTVIIIADCVVDSQIILKDKNLTITTDGVKDHKIICTYTTAFALRLEADSKSTSPSTIKVLGTETARLIFDGNNINRSKAMVLAQYNTVTFEYVNFINSNNSADHGAGLQVSAKTICTANNCLFENLKTTASGKVGAAVYITQSSGNPGKFYANNCVFNNISSTGSGVIRATGSFFVDGCTFTNCKTADAILSSDTSKAYSRSIKNSTFDVLEVEAHVTDTNLTTTDNTYGVTPPPTQTKTTAAYTGLAYDPSYFVSGIDLKKMDVKVEGLLDELLPAGDYTIQVTAKEGYVFSNEAYTEKYNVTITAPEGTGSTKLFMSAEVRDTITAVFFASVDADTVALYDNIVLYAKLGNGNEKQLEKVEDGNGNYTFRYEHIYSQRMNDKLTARVVGIKSDNTEVVLDSITEGISIADYCNIVATNELYSSNTKLLTFMANMLAFGDACQAYANYNTANPATAGKTWITALVGDAAPVSPVAAEDLSKKETTCNASITAAGLNIENKISVYFMVETNDVANTKVKIGSSEESIVEYNLAEYEPVGGKYMITLTAIEPAFYNDVITAKVYIGETLQHTVNYSVNTYCARMAGEDGIGALAKAIYNYGVAAAAYMDK